MEKAVLLDPEFARAYVALAAMYLKAVLTAGLPKSVGVTDKASLDAAKLMPLFLLQNAMKKPTALAHGLMSQIYLYRHMHDEALAEIERAVEMDPNDPELYSWMSNIFGFMGKYREAIDAAKTGQRLDPNNPSQYLLQLGRVNFYYGNLQESLTLMERAMKLNPGLSGSASFGIALIYATQGRNEEAHAAYEIFRKKRILPPTVKLLMPLFPFADPETSNRYADALIKAGVSGTLNGNYRISRQNLLNGQVVKSLLFGRKITGSSFGTDKQSWWEWTTNGEFKYTIGEYRDTGKSWLEGDVFFIQFEKQFGGLPSGNAIFRNPRGSRENKNEYYLVSDLRFIIPFSVNE